MKGHVKITLKSTGYLFIANSSIFIGADSVLLKNEFKLLENGRVLIDTKSQNP